MNEKPRQVAPGITVDKQAPSPGFDVTTPGGLHLSFHGAWVVGLLALVVCVAISGWIAVSIASINHGGSYVPLNHITMMQHPHNTNFFMRVKQ